MNRDIDYAAVAVRTAIVAKFGRTNELNDLKATAHDKTIVVQHGQRMAEGTRDQLLAALRSADSYDKLWEACQPAN
jgi:hypothetical protein